MPGRHPAGLLHVQPEAIPAVRAAFEEGVAQVRSHLVLLQDEALIRQPWLGDDTSAAVVAHYDQRVIQDGEGPLAAMRQYEQELIRILDSLKAIESSYPRVDDANAGGFRA